VAPSEAPVTENATRTRRLEELNLRISEALLTLLTLLSVLAPPTPGLAEKIRFHP